MKTINIASWFKRQFAIKWHTAQASNVGSHSMTEFTQQLSCSSQASFCDSLTSERTQSLRSKQSMSATFAQKSIACQLFRNTRGQGTLSGSISFLQALILRFLEAFESNRVRAMHADATWFVTKVVQPWKLMCAEWSQDSDPTGCRHHQWKRPFLGAKELLDA